MRADCRVRHIRSISIVGVSTAHDTNANVMRIAIKTAYAEPPPECAIRKANEINGYNFVR
jgi:hypothetical protein